MIVVFVGPTIGESEVLSHLDCEVRPPVSHGDLIRLMADPPSAIGIIDGYFEGAPSVWHKEILYAMDQGIHVFGASSMGALRAAELDVFGMQGVGTIYEWYRDGVIEDDDEVAVQHGPAEIGFLVASEPMVSIRATLALAVEKGVLDQDAQELLVGLGKGLFYKERSWQRMIDAASGKVHSGVLKTLDSWLGENRIDLKRADAVAMLELMKDRADSFEAPFETSFHFEWTNVWDTAWKSLRATGLSGSGAIPEIDRRVLDEIRLNRLVYGELKALVVAAWASEHVVDTDVSLEDTRRALSVYREQSGLVSREQLLDFLDQQGLSEAALTGLMERRVRMAQIERAAMVDRDGFDRLMLDQLKLEGGYLRCLEAVHEKIANGVYERSEARDWRISRVELLEWYADRFSPGLDDDGLARHISAIDLDGRDEFYVLVGTEYLMDRTR